MVEEFPTLATEREVIGAMVVQGKEIERRDDLMV